MTTFSDLFTFSRSGNATMVDADGNLKWAPHNLLTYSEDFTDADWFKGPPITVAEDAIGPDGSVSATTVTTSATLHALYQSVTVTAETTYTFSFYAKRGTMTDAKYSVYDESNLTNIVAPTSYYSDIDSSNFELVSVTFTTPVGCTSIRVYPLRDSGVVGTTIIYGAHFYRSDLGGMVNNPERGDSYVPTTSAAVYMPRTGHHIWDGSQWVNEGLLIESESRTNLITHSEDFADASWGVVNAATPTADSVGPDGGTNSAHTLVDDSSGGTGGVFFFTDISGLATSTDYTWSCFCKADQLDWVFIEVNNLTNPGNGGVFFDLSAGTVGSGGGTDPLAYSGTIEYFGNGWYRCAVSFTTDIDTSGRVLVRPADGDSDPTADLDGTSSILIYGAQLEEGPTPSSYIPTAGSTVTRAAETLTAPSANLPWWTDNITYLSDELVTNGTFDTDTTGWSVDNGSLSVVSGKLRVQSVDETGEFLYIELSSSIPAGSTVGIQWDFGDTDNGSFDVRMGFHDTAPVSTADRNDEFFSETFLGNFDNASYSAFQEITTEANYLIIQFNHNNSGISSYFDLDNISVREIETPAISIARDGLETYADGDTAGQVALYDRRVDANNRITLTLDTDSTKTGTFTLTLANGFSTETISTTGEITPGVNKPFNLAFVATSTELGIALNGTAETRVSHTLGLPDLSSADATYEGMGARALVREWADDVDEEEASA